MTTDEQGYIYTYDYENRIVAINKNLQTKAQFAYDALGRRIEKIDSVDSTKSMRYYYNDRWQISKTSVHLDERC